MAEETSSDSQKNINMEATAHDQSKVTMVGQMQANTVIIVTAQRDGKPFQAPTLPSYNIDRPEITQKLQTRLFNSSNNCGLVLSAIHGLGGIGKTTLAIALAHDEEAKKIFADGVLWTILGKTPDLLGLLSNWIQALGDYDFRPTTVDAASSHLRTLLYDKAVMLVVDDAWDQEHIKPFLVGGQKCQLIITTRRPDIASEVGAELYQLDLMTEEESLALFTRILGRELEEKEIEEVKLLAEAVG
ncbi:MAG: NB-ARC domain-containing protein, partial [Cyanobacteria bacterium J06639_18]